MDRAEVEAKVKDLVVEVLQIEPPTKVTPEATFKDDLNTDSLDYVELVMALEEAFDIVVPDLDLETIRTVSDVTDLVVDALGVREGTS